jgi:acid stress-induced BolA-like protein IbaG/YrbA
MTNPNEVAELIKQNIPDAQVQAEDMTGTGDHFQIFVVSSIFKGKLLIDQHRLVQEALKEAMNDGRIHAVHITTRIPNDRAEKSKSDDFKIMH